MADGKARKKLGETLIERGLLTTSELQAALGMQEKAPEQTKLGQILVREGILAERVLKDLLAETEQLEAVDLTKFQIPIGIREVFPKSLSDLYQVVPIRFNARFHLEIAMEDPQNFNLIDEIQFVSGLVLEPKLAGRKEIGRCLARSEGAFADAEEVTMEMVCDPNEVTQKMQLDSQWWMDVIIG